MPGDKVSTHSGHRKRMRDRYRLMGLDGFAPHEALELILFYAIPQRDVNPLAHRLIDEFGSLDACLFADASQLVKIPGMGESTARFLNTVGKACELYASFSENRMDLSKFKNAVAYIKRLFDEADGEETWAICMDKMGRLLGAGKVNRAGWNDEGTAKGALRLVIKNHASTLVLVDKRRSGNAEITVSDAKTADDISRMMGMLGVLTIDMVIASGDEVVSLRRKKVFDPTLNLKEADRNLAGLYTNWLD